MSGTNNTALQPAPGTEERHLTPAQWLPKPATRWLPQAERSLREMWSPFEAEREGAGGPARGDARPTLRLPPVKEIPRERMTLRQLQDSQQAHQASIALEAEVRKLAREHGLDTAEVTQLARASWGAFRIVNGEALPVAGDRQTVLLSADGVNVLSVADWVAKQVRVMGRGARSEDGKWMPSPGPAGHPLPSDGRGTWDDDEALPMVNPFRRKTWNLTAQMQLERRDPRLARRLKAEARVEGENRAPKVNTKG